MTKKRTDLLIRCDGIRSGGARVSRVLRSEKEAISRTNSDQLNIVSQFAFIVFTCLPEALHRWRLAASNIL